MANKKVLSNNKCDDCKFAKWHTQQWNLDCYGRPLTYECTQRVFDRAEVRGKRGCELWQHK